MEFYALNEAEIEKAKELIEREMEKEGKVEDVFDDEADGFLHQLASEFYTHEDSSERADDVLRDIIKLMGAYRIEILSGGQGVVYHRQ